MPKTPDEQVGSPECVGYAPNITSGVCQCKVCAGKPVELRTRRPFRFCIWCSTYHPDSPAVSARHSKILCALIQDEVEEEDWDGGTILILPKQQGYDD